jgi:signal transduction histidine kinase
VPSPDRQLRFRYGATHLWVIADDAHEPIRCPDLRGGICGPFFLGDAIFGTISAHSPGKTSISRGAVRQVERLAERELEKVIPMPSPLRELSLVPNTAGHGVQFYEDADYLFAVVAEFVSKALAGGQSAVLIVKEDHLSGVVAALESRGVDMEAEGASGRVVLLDARETAASLMEGSSPDPRRLEEMLGELLRRRDGQYVLCLFGEMVNVLWEDGQVDAAIELERYWDAAIARLPISLLCAYPIERFAAADGINRFAEICEHHRHVAPTESIAERQGNARLAEIARLQQKAQILEAEIRHRMRLETELQDAVAERDLLLEREREARSEAEDANRAKRDFLAVMSHELRTPLNAIAGYTELLELGVPGPVTAPQREYLERIRDSQRRLLSLIDEVLVFSRTEAGKTRYLIESVPVDEIARGADLCVLPQLHAKRISYSYSIADPELMVRADREKLQQIVVSLLSNAIKFTPVEGTVTLACTASDEWIRLEVRDTGVGIPSDKLDAIFEPFVQVGTALTREHEGAGLGLAISREFARAMGGELRVADTSDQGSTFRLLLPRVAAE